MQNAQEALVDRYDGQTQAIPQASRDYSTIDHICGLAHCCITKYSGRPMDWHFLAWATRSQQLELYSLLLIAYWGLHQPAWHVHKSPMVGSRLVGSACLCRIGTEEKGIYQG